MAEKDVDPVSSPPPSDIANEPSKSLEESSSPFSRLGLFYINSLIDLGYKRELVHTDLGPVSERDKCLPLFEKFFGLWELEMKKPLKKQSLWMVLWRTVGFGRLFLALFLYACSAAAAYGPILILSALVIYFENPNASNRAPISTIWIYVALMFVLPMASSIFAAQSNIIFAHIGLQFRNALVNMIYRKALKLSPASRQKQSTGMIVNMFSNDTKQLQQFTYFMNNCAIAPFQIIVSLVLIYYEVGPATFVGLGMMFLVIPLNLYIFITLNRLRQKKVKKTDIRVKLMNEILSGIRVIKFYAWESPFMSSVLESRREELVILKQMAYIVAVGFTLVLQALPVVQPVLVFYTFIKLGNELTAAIAFTTISLFNLMQFPFAFLPLGLAQYSQSLVSTQRMHKFFLSDELDPYVNRNDESLPVDVAIKLDNLSVCWVKAEDVTVAADKDDSKVAIVADAQTALEASPDDAKESEPLPDHVADETEPLQLHSEHDLKDDTHKGEDSQAVRDAIDADKAARINQIIQNRMMVDMGMTLKKTASVYTSDPENLGRSRSLMGYESIRPMQDGQQVDSINRSASTLMDVSLTIKQGQLVAVVGTVGSGKSSFLSAILGEMHCQEGSVSLFGSVAYCEQRPWILNATVLENILFGDPLIPARLDAAIHAANLEDDIRVLQGGLQTEIGERGINLSGGQKARVALARAVYKNCDIYLLDDPLSAVDAHVGQHIFRHCIRGALKSKTRILVTHHVHLLPKCDLVVILQDGRVKAQGTYQELQKSGIDISAFVPASSDDDIELAEEDEVDEETSVKSSWKDTTKKLATDTAEEKFDPATELGPASKDEESEALVGISGGTDNGGSVLSRQQSANIEDVVELSKEAELAASERKLDRRSSQIMSIEEKNTGDVTTSVYSYYIRSGGVWLFCLVLLGLTASQGAAIAAQFQLAAWGSKSATDSANGSPLSSQQNLDQLQTFAWISMIAVFLITLRAIALANHRIGTSTNLHKDVLVSIFGAPVAFFDVTPLGRILNRFSSDMLTIDEELSQTISQLSNSLFQCIGAICAVAAATLGTFLILMIPMGYWYFWIQKRFRKTNTAIARLEAVSRSPIYTDFSQALIGAQSIRAYQDEERFIKRLENCVDANSIAGITQQLSANWLALRLDFLGSTISFFIALVAVASGGNFIPAGFLALGLSYSFQVTTYMKFAVRMIATFEAQMNSVERVKTYSEEVPQEDDDNDRLIDPSTLGNWPSSGKVEASGVELAYRDGPLVLKGISFKVAASEKIGIAGRTGSGKSSLMIALFRIQDLVDGRILIDDVDISTIPVKHLRSHLGIIPQDPVMFSAPVRFNLDPFNEYTDAEIWDTLDSVDMKNHVLSLPNKLTEDVAEGGDNFSAGQRQLICIARAILRKPKILVLDEATASIDNETDALIQRTIRSSFKEATVLTIAHRLHTIIDSDRILVLENGQVAEMDAPDVLVNKEGGVFASLWERHKLSEGEAH